MSQVIPSQEFQSIVRDAATFRQEPSIVNTQVLVRDIVELLQSGLTPEEIPGHLFDLVTITQVSEAIKFYQSHQAEIDEAMVWYRDRPMLNVPAGLRLNPLRDEVQSSIEFARQEAADLSEWIEAA